MEAEADEVDVDVDANAVNNEPFAAEAQPGENVPPLTKSTLLAYFKLNGTDPFSRTLSYLEVPEHYRYVNLRFRRHLMGYFGCLGGIENGESGCVESPTDLPSEGYIQPALRSPNCVGSAYCSYTSKARRNSKTFDEIPIILFFFTLRSLQPASVEDSSWKIRNGGCVSPRPLMRKCLTNFVACS